MVPLERARTTQQGFGRIAYQDWSAITQHPEACTERIAG